MSNPPPPPAGGATASSGGVAATSPLPPAASMVSPSPGPRLARKRNVSRSIAESADVGTPVRGSVAKDEDPSLMVAGTVELAAGGGDSISKKASVPRSSARLASQAIENHSHRDALSTKPKLLKLSLQANKPSGSGGGGGAAAASQSRFSKNLFPGSLQKIIIFILVTGIATTFWSWKTQPSILQDTTVAGQVAGLEEILRKTTKMMQVQLDLVDMKIHKETQALRKDLEEKIDEQATTFSTELRIMHAKTEDIEASLKHLMDAGFPSRKDVVSLISAAVDKRAAEGTGKAFSLDDVLAVARHLMEVELDKHNADGIGRVDYALGTGGGRVVDHSEGFYHGLRNGIWHQFSGSKHPLASKILEPSFGEPGQCLPLKGSNVYVEIALRTSIFPDAFSLEHVTKSVAYDVSSAPKEFRVFGWLDSYKKDDAALKSVTQLLLGEFMYDTEKKSVQSFNVPQDSMRKLINMVRLEVFSNYGSPSHTCLYRFRVHGSESKGSLPYHFRSNAKF